VSRKKKEEVVTKVQAELAAAGKGLADLRSVIASAAEVLSTGTEGRNEDGSRS
jgi:hypothetical protein